MEKNTKQYKLLFVVEYQLSLAVSLQSYQACMQLSKYFHLDIKDIITVIHVN